MKLLIAYLLLCAALHAQNCGTNDRMITAAKLRTTLDLDGLPQPGAWQSANPIRFCADWQGHNADPQRQTEVRVLYSRDTLYFQFRANYRALYVYPGGPQRRDELWNRDVAEVFLQPDHQSGRTYAEIEVSPNGDWIDLAITNGARSDLESKLKSRVTVHEAEKLWTAEIAIPMTSITKSFDPKRPWRANFFRVEAPEPNRFYSSWQATNTPQPNFHVPEVFATLKFEQ